MLLWLTFGLLSAAVATILLRAPSGDDRAAGAVRGDDPDAAVYRDQLVELDGDVARGIVGESEAAAARVEIARRLLKHVGGDPASQSAAAEPAGKSASSGVAAGWLSADRVLVSSAMAIPIVGLGVYLLVGQPGLPGRPHAERIAQAPDKASVQDLIAKVEQRLRENPNDGMGWQVIAPVYIGQGRFVEAGQAYERSIQLLGETPERLMALAKALVLANNGIVVPPARAAYERALQLDGSRAEAKFWLAIAEEQNGRTKEAAAAYRSMLAEASADAPWRDAVVARLEGLEGNRNGQRNEASNPAANIPGVPTGGAEPAAPRVAERAPATAPPGQPASGLPSAPILAPANGPKPAGAGPTPAEFVAAAEKLPVEMREMMLGRMVARATDAVKAAPKDTAAWSRIVTGLKALGKPTEATDALKQARAALGGDAAAEAEFDALARTLGLAS